MGNFWASSEYMVFDFIFLSYMQHSKVKKEKTALSFHGAKGALLSSHLVTKAPPHNLPFKVGFFWSPDKRGKPNTGF